MNGLGLPFLKNRVRIAALLGLAGCLSGQRACSQQLSVDSLKQQLTRHREEDTNRVILLNTLSVQYTSIDYRQVLRYAGQALELAEKLSYEAGIATAKNGLALGNLTIDEDGTAIRHALRAEAIAEKNQLPEVLAESYRIIGSAYMNQGNLERAELYYAKAEQFVRQTPNRTLLARILTGSGTIQLRKNKDQVALTLYRKSLAILKEQKAVFFIPIVLSNIGETYGRPIFHDAKRELAYYKEALVYARNSGNRFAEARVLSNLGKALIAQNRYPESERYLLEALRVSRKTGTRGTTTAIYMNLVELNLKQNNFPAVQQYIQKYHDLRDSLVNEKQTRSIVELEAQLNSEKKEQTIRWLEQEKRWQTTSKNFWIIGSVLLFAAILIIYFLQQSRNRKARQLLDVQKALIEKLKETDLLKSRFFANISHEFRTPLSLILAPLEELQSSPRSTLYDQKELKRMERNANRLLDLVNQLLDLSKLEAGKMNLQLQQGHLQEWLRFLVSSFGSLAEARQIQFSKQIDVLAEEVWFDKDKLEKIMTNILANAFNFTEPGGSVMLLVETSQDATELVITLMDTGKGISDEDLPHVFSPFYQSKNRADAGQPGTGLGLALVNELVKLHKGTLDLTSQLYTGTTIAIRLPIRREDLAFGETVFVETATTAPAKPPFEAFTGTDAQREASGSDCLLVVEDNLELRNFIADLFQNQFRVITAVNGEQGVSMAIEAIPDLIISDVMMPKMDGIQLTESIRSNDLTSHIPVLLLTAKSDAESRMDGFRTGADEYLSKPFSPEELRVRVANLLAMRKKLAAKYRHDLLAEASPVRMLSYDDKFVISVRAVVDAHLSDSLFSVEQLAEEMCLSRTQLFRKVKALLEISPSELINDIRLQRAAELIRSKADSLTQISYSVGFSEQSYFAKRFRKKFGVSPSEYANS